MSFEGLQERLTALQETTAQLKELIDRLHNLKFQPGSVPLGGADDDNVATELSSEINQILREEDEELELLQEEIEDLRAGRPGSDAEHAKTRLKDGVERLKRELRSSRATFRRAQLAAKQSLAQAQRLERQLLLQSYAQPASQASTPPVGTEGTEGTEDQAPAQALRHRHHHQPAQHQTSSLSEGDQQTVGASGNVTSALRRTHDLIAAELARSDFAHQTLTESSQALSRLDESYGSLEGMLASSKDLLGTLVRSQKSDTWYLQTALYMLLTTGAWLVFRRLLFGPTWWLVWLPVKMIYGLLVGGGGAVIKYGGGGSGLEESPAVGVEDTKVEVEGVPGDELPTADVGGEGSGADAEGNAVEEDGAEPDSMVDKVGRIVDEEAEVRFAEEGVGEQQAAADEQASQQRDEL